MAKTCTDQEQAVVEYEALSPGVKALFWAIVVFMTLWGLAGIVGFVVSLVCFSAKGGLVEKAIGLLLAMFFGPFFWLYYALNKNYCKM